MLMTFAHSSRQLSAFLSPLDIRAGFRLYHLVYDLTISTVGHSLTTF